jgi:hypothetical protein
MTPTLEQLETQAAVLAEAIRLARAAKVIPPIDTTRIVGGIDAAIAGLSAAVVALQAVRTMLTNNEAKAETAVTVHLPEAVDMSDGVPVVIPTVTPAPASIEAAAVEAAAPKKKGWAKVWAITKKVAKVAVPVAIAGAGGGVALPTLLPGILASLSDPTVAGAAGAGIAGLASAGVRIYGQLKTDKPKE